MPDLPVLIGIDFGTQSLRAIAFDSRGRKLASAARPTPQTSVPIGAEYDPDLIFEMVVAVLAEIGQALAGRPVAGIAVASIGESCILVGADGRALAPAILWFDRRTEAPMRDIAARVDADRVFAITGLSLDPIFSLFKLAWMRQHWPDAFARAKRVLLMADWIAYRLSGEAATDPSLASRTLYFDVHRRAWSEEMLALGGIDPRLPAAVRPSGTALGAVRAEVLAATGLAGRPMVGVGGHDHIVGAFAAGLIEPGVVLNSIGTAEALLLATPAPLGDPAVAEQGYFQGAAGTDRAMSYLGGSIYSSGGAVDWFRSVSGGGDQDTLITEATRVPAGSGGVVFLPHLANAPPPSPDQHPRGAFAGLTLAATRPALYRAVLEGLAMQAKAMLDGMLRLTGLPAPRAIRVIGGGSRNRLGLSIRAAVFGQPIVVVDEPEATALGAALLGGVAAGLFRNLDEALAGLDRREHVVEPGEAVAFYRRLREGVFEPMGKSLAPIHADLARLEP